MNSHGEKSVLKPRGKRNGTRISIMQIRACARISLKQQELHLWGLALARYCFKQMHCRENVSAHRGSEIAYYSSPDIILHVTEMLIQYSSSAATLALQKKASEISMKIRWLAGLWLGSRFSSTQRNSSSRNAGRVLVSERGSSSAVSQPCTSGDQRTQRGS